MFKHRLAIYSSQLTFDEAAHMLVSPQHVRHAATHVGRDTILLLSVAAQLESVA